MDNEIMNENLEENVEENMEEKDNVDVEDIVDATVDSKKGSRLCYQIAPNNKPGPYWDDIEGIVTDVSDMDLSMIQNW